MKATRLRGALAAGIAICASATSHALAEGLAALSNGSAADVGTGWNILSIPAAAFVLDENVSGFEYQICTPTLCSHPPVPPAFEDLASASWRIERRMGIEDVHREEPGRERWLRNIAVALGNAPADTEVIAALQKRVDDPSPLVREHVAWALERHQRAGA